MCGDLGQGFPLKAGFGVRAQEAPASGLEKPPANGGITKIRSQTGPASGGIGNEMERDQQYDTRRDTIENLDCF